MRLCTTRNGLDASDFHGQGVDMQRRDEFNNGETPKSQGFHPGEDGEAR